MDDHAEVLANELRRLVADGADRIVDVDEIPLAIDDVDDIGDGLQEVHVLVLGHLQVGVLRATLSRTLSALRMRRGRARRWPWAGRRKTNRAASSRTVFSTRAMSSSGSTSSIAGSGQKVSQSARAPPWKRKSVTIASALIVGIEGLHLGYVGGIKYLQARIGGSEGRGEGSLSSSPSTAKMILRAAPRLAVSPTPRV